MVKGSLLYSENSSTPWWLKDIDKDDKTSDCLSEPKNPSQNVNIHDSSGRVSWPHKHLREAL